MKLHALAKNLHYTMCIFHIHVYSNIQISISYIFVIWYRASSKRFSANKECYGFDNISCMYMYKHMYMTRLEFAKLQPTVCNYGYACAMWSVTMWTGTACVSESYNETVTARAILVPHVGYWHGSDVGPKGRTCLCNSYSGTSNNRPSEEQPTSI